MLCKICPAIYDAFDRLPLIDGNVLAFTIAACPLYRGRKLTSFLILHQRFLYLQLTDVFAILP